MADQQSDDGQLFELALFAGAGGGILGGKLLGWRTICAVELDQYCASILVARQNDGLLEPFPIWSDIRSFRPSNPECREMFKMLRSIRHRLVITGGFPCQDISVAGNGTGIEGIESSLWFEQVRIIRSIRPRFALVENSPALTSRGLDRVLGDLAEMGFDAEWGVFSAADTGARHERERLWIVGSDNCQKRISSIGKESLQRIDSFPWSEDVRRIEDLRERPDLFAGGLWRTSNGVANYVDRIKAIGNGQVPRVVSLAWSKLMETD